MRISRSTAVLAFVGLAVAAPAAMADFTRNINVTAEYFQADAQGNLTMDGNNQPIPVMVSHSFDLLNDFALDGVGADGTQWYRLSSGYTFGASAATAPSLNEFRVGIRQDPSVSLAFNTTAGPTLSNFTFTSSLVSFASIPSAQAIASAAISVTDSLTFGDVGSITLNGLFGGSAFTTKYNGGVAGGTTFENLLSGVGTIPVAPGITSTFMANSASHPFYDPIGGSVDDIQSQFKFSLSRFDRASGTSVFDIIPAPGASALLALGGLAAFRRRRS